MKKPVTLALDEGVLEFIDEKRGHESRSSYVGRILNGTLRIAEVPVVRPVTPKPGPPFTTAAIAEATRAMYRCPDNRCDRTFGSAQAKCPVHGRTAVPK